MAQDENKARKGRNKPQTSTAAASSSSSATINKNNDQRNNLSSTGSNSSRIPLFVAQSKSSSNVAGLGEELPESVRREHQQHLAGRHPQR